MAGEILVVVRRADRIEELLPYLAEVARPGMKLVFLLPYPVHWWSYFRDHCITTESRTKAALEGRKAVEGHCWRKQRLLLEQKVFAAGEAFRKMGVGIAVDLYAGNLRRVVWDYAAKGEVHLIVTQARKGFPLLRFLHKMILPFGLDPKRPSFPAVLLHLNRRRGGARS